MTDDGELAGADRQPIHRGDRVEGEIRGGRHVIGEVRALYDDVVVVWNEDETPHRERSGKYYTFRQA